MWVRVVGVKRDDVQPPSGEQRLPIPAPGTGGPAHNAANGGAFSGARTTPAVPDTWAHAIKAKWGASSGTVTTPALSDT